MGRRNGGGEAGRRRCRCRRTEGEPGAQGRHPTRLHRSAHRQGGSRRRGVGRLGADQAGDGGGCLGQLGIGLITAFGDGLRDAVAEVLVEQAERHRLQRAVDRAYLGEDVDAVLVLVDHLRDAADLPLDAAQPLGVVVLVGRVAVGLVRLGFGGHGLLPNIFCIWSISACCAVMMFCASCLASTFCPLAISALAISMAPWWCPIIDCSHNVSNAVPFNVASFAMVASSTMPPIAMPPCAPCPVSSPGFSFHCTRKAFMVSISGCWAAAICWASVISSGLVD